MKIKARQVIVTFWLLFFCFECLGYGCQLSFDKSKEGQIGCVNKESSQGLPLILEENTEDTDDKRSIERTNQDGLIFFGAVLPSSLTSYGSIPSIDQNQFLTEQPILLRIGKLTL